MSRTQKRGGGGDDPAGTRTQDLRIKSPLLYQLSYAFGRFARKLGQEHGLRCFRRPGFGGERSVIIGEGDRKLNRLV